MNIVVVYVRFVFINVYVISNYFHCMLDVGEEKVP